MKEKMTKTGKRRYEAPTSWLIDVDAEHQLLAGSPPARPGGNRGGRITITTATPDQSSDPDDDILDED